jgi:hypothetical protein
VAAAEIAATLGGAHRSGGWWRCRRPVHDGRGETLALRDGVRGLILKSRPAAIRATRRDRERRIEIDRRVWDVPGRASN